MAMLLRALALVQIAGFVVYAVLQSVHRRKSSWNILSTTGVEPHTLGVFFLGVRGDPRNTPRRTTQPVCKREQEEELDWLIFV
ncbi:hypothetical protein BaRGS_00020910 [Batillaria attramentaria]|uniref:Secreted protein n=1 Tax=Batillaria attramentaria TaxID=370345 RepID=A0ABD0KLH9_9CAEN